MTQPTHIVYLVLRRSINETPIISPRSYNSSSSDTHETSVHNIPPSTNNSSPDDRPANEAPFDPLAHLSIELYDEDDVDDLINTMPSTRSEGRLYLILSTHSSLHVVHVADDPDSADEKLFADANMLHRECEQEGGKVTLKSARSQQQPTDDGEDVIPGVAFDVAKARASEDGDEVWGHYWSIWKVSVEKLRSEVKVQ